MMGREEMMALGTVILIVGIFLLFAGLSMTLRLEQAERERRWKSRGIILEHHKPGKDGMR